LAAYREPNEPNILPKANEAIWFIGKNVVKFSDDASFIANRARRAEQIAGFVPALTGQTKNMYSYQLVEGDVLSERVNVPMFARLLAHCRNFWQLAELNPAEQSSFQQQCMKFYRNKTLERVDLYYKNFGTQDGTETQNGVSMPLLAELLQNVDWDSLARGLPGRFHGDFHFENIIVNQAGDAFTFLDWRQDFGGSISVGDIYYDFAKLMHGLIVNHELIAKDLYRVERNEHNVTPHIDFDFHRKQILVECERFFLAWLEQHGYDSHKVLVLTALIYLNIAALHHAPYCHLLYALGKDMLYHAQQTMSHSGNH
jgi:aminoglycoside phosphotransferase (APT) family kinase protein